MASESKKRRGGSKRKASGTGRELKNNETAFVSFAPTALHPEGEPIIARSDEGRYRYLGNIPDYADIKVDTDSSDYKQAQRDYNVKLRLLSNGGVEVSKGGLYSRARTYTNIDNFKQDVIHRINSRASFDIAELGSLQKGYISQIKAEYYRGLVKKNSSSMALKAMNEAIKGDMQSIKSRLDVAEKAKRKLTQIIDQAKK